jgi:hypothetical protein
MDRYSPTDRAFGCVALFLIGVIGWICDRVAAFQNSIIADNHSKQGVSR